MSHLQTAFGYTRIETGGTNPTLSTINILCNALDINFSQLFEGFIDK